MKKMFVVVVLASVSVAGACGSRKSAATPGPPGPPGPIEHRGDATGGAAYGGAAYGAARVPVKGATSGSVPGSGAH